MSFNHILTFGGDKIDYENNKEYDNICIVDIIDEVYCK